MRSFKIFASIADIHIGNKHISAENMKAQLKEHFIKVLRQMKYLDGIFILGDMLHTIVSLNSDYSEVFYWFVDQIYKVARKQHAVVIIIKGTPSHDNDQLNNIKHYQSNDDGVDFRIYDTIEEITIWDDYNVLVLPDLRVKRLKDIDKYLDKQDRYDLILGHGTIESMQFFIQESENMSTKTYLYNVDKLRYACKGPIQFGHIHSYTNIGNQFYYAGPFTLLERGGDSAGFLITGIYDKDRSRFRVERYDNPDTAQYFRLEVTKQIIDTYPIDEIMEAIDTIIAEAKKNDLITLNITRGDERDSTDKVIMLEERYRSDKRFSIIKKVKSKKEEESEKENEERKAKYDYVLDDNMKMSEMIYRYYISDVYPTMSEQQRNKVNITIELISKLLGESDD